MNEIFIKILTTTYTVVLPILIGCVGTLVKDRKREKREILDALKDMADRVSCLETKIDDNYAEECRVRILRFEDEMRLGVKHSQAHFEQAVKDCGSYESYVEAHEGFHNGIGEAAMKHIKDVYADCLREDAFL